MTTKIKLMPLDFITLLSSHWQTYTVRCDSRRKVEDNLDCLKPEELAAFRKACEEYDSACTTHDALNLQLKTQRDRVLTVRTKIKKEKRTIADYRRKILKAEAEITRLEEVEYEEHVQTMCLVGSVNECNVEGKQGKFQQALKAAEEHVDATQQKLVQLKAIEAQMAELKAQHEALLRS